MQYRAGNNRTCKLNRFKNSRRSYSARSSDLHFNIKKSGDFFLRRIFKCHGPFGVLRRCTEDFTVRKAVNFNNRTVNIKIVIFAVFAYKFYVINCVTDIFISVIRNRNRKSEFFYKIQSFTVCCKSFAFTLLNIENKNIKTAFGAYFRIFLAK